MSRPTNLTINREKFITILKERRQTWVDAFAAKVKEVEDGNKDLDKRHDAWWVETKKVVRAAAAEVAKAPKPLPGEQIQLSANAYLSGGHSTTDRAQFHVSLPVRPVTQHKPNRSNHEGNLREIDAAIRMLELADNESIKLGYDMMHWADPSYAPYGKY
jgi:hypothetical protein